MRTPINDLTPYASNLVLQAPGTGSIASNANKDSLSQKDLAKDRSNVPACGSNLLDLKIGDSGLITSPNYPEDYPPDSECTWWLKVIKRRQKSINLESIIPIILYHLMNPR